METRHSEWWRQAPGPTDRDGVCSSELIGSFDIWLSRRLSEACRRGQNLAFFDTGLFRDPDGLWNGWAHIFFDPDCPPVLGDRWTVYEIFPAG